MGKKQRTAPVRPPSRKQLSRWQRERKLQRMVIVAGVLIVALMLAIPAFGYYREFYARGREAVVAVNDRTRTMDEYVRAIAYRDYLLDLQQAFLQQQARDTSSDSAKALAGFANQQLQRISLQRAVVGTQVVEDMIDDELVRDGAAKLGLSVAADEVTQAIQDRLLAPPKPDEQVDEAKRQADFAERYKRVLSDSGLTEAEYRSFVEIELLRQKLDDKLREQVPTTAEQVHLLGILVSTEEEAKSLREKLAAGEDFAELAKNTSLDATLREKGGDMGWLPRGVREAEFDEIAFALAPNQISEPVASGQGYYVLKLLEKGTREIEAAPLDDLKAAALDNWLAEQKQTNKVSRFIDSDKQAWAMDQASRLRNKRQAS